MEIEQITLALAAQEQGSFAKAAERAGLDPSVVSRQIAGLERRLGFRLFERTTRRLAVTEAGQAYLDRVRPLLADLGEAEAAARDLVAMPKGRLRVTASTAFGQVVIVPMLSAFQAAHPDLTVELRLSDGLVDMVGEGVDVAVRLSREAPADTVVRRLMRVRYRVVAAPDWAGRLERPEDLSDVGCVVFPYPGFRDVWQFRKGGALMEVPVRGSLEITGALALAEAARHGLGPALLAEWLVAGDLASGRLVDLFPDHEVAATGFDSAAWVMFPSRAYLPLKTRRFIEALTDHVAETKESGG
ncbi:MAG: LysR substrate-binding domain-containing protein [Pseudomonadota bacterium]